jgi:hypothetical protein
MLESLMGAYLLSSLQWLQVSHYHTLICQPSPITSPRCTTVRAYHVQYPFPSFLQALHTVLYMLDWPVLRVVKFGVAVR